MNLRRFLQKAARRSWMKYAMRGVGGADNYERLDLAYQVADPWHMDSPGEQARFEGTNRLIERHVGRVGSVLLTAGNVVKANEATACVINQISPIYIAFSVPERYLPAVMAKMRQGGLEIAAAPPGAPEAGAVTAPIVEERCETRSG